MPGWPRSRRSAAWSTARPAPGDALRGRAAARRAGPALAPRPRLLLCDEPVSALDLPSRHALIDRLAQVQQAEAIPVLYVTHSPAEAIALGTPLFCPRAGQAASPRARRWTCSRASRGTSVIRLEERAATSFPASIGTITPRDQGDPAPARRRPGPDRPAPRPARRARPSWSRSAPTTSCWPRGPIAGLSAEPDRRDRRAGRPPRLRGRGPGPHRRMSPGSSASSPPPSSSLRSRRDRTFT